jgi:hypothetical protein
MKNAQTLSVASGEDSGENIRLSGFENRVLREISGANRDEVTGDWRKLCNEELRDFFSVPYFCVIKLMRMRWAGHVALELSWLYILPMCYCLNNLEHSVNFCVM